MIRWAVGILALVPVHSGSWESRPLREPTEPESFVPFEAPAYRLINSVSFSPDDQVMYFALFQRAVLRERGLPIEDAPEIGLYSARRSAQGWEEPQSLPFSGAFKDYEPSLAPDGTFMVFNSMRPYADGRVPTKNDLWMVALEEGVWGEPARIEALSSFDHEESYATSGLDGILVYVRGQEGPHGEPVYDLYESRFVEGAFTAPTRHPVSSDRWGEGDPWLSPDGTYLIFTRWDDELGWASTVDLHISFREGDTWSEPVPLDELNTPGPDYSPAVSADGEWLYYRANSRFMRTAMDSVLVRYAPD